MNVLEEIRQRNAVRGHANAAAAAADCDRLIAYAEQLAAGLVTTMAVAEKALAHWDNDEESKVGKLLACLSGNMKGSYRHDIDAVHALVEEITGTDPRPIAHRIAAEELRAMGWKSKSTGKPYR